MEQLANPSCTKVLKWMFEKQQQQQQNHTM